MKMIKPIVNISKIAEGFDLFLLGLNGVITEDAGIRSEVIEALLNLRRYNKKIVLITNSSSRVASIAKLLHENKVPLAVFDSIISAGEILHYKLKCANGEFAALGELYYQLGNPKDDGVFASLNYRRIDSLEKAHFIYMHGVGNQEDVMDKYRPQLEHAAGLGLPFVCAGNDTSCFIKGKIGLATGAFAEQYAVLGGRIITVGKPDVNIFKYSVDGLENFVAGRTLMIGDNIATDIKGANLLGIPSALVSKGIHVNFLGEGYIPDVAKTRELASNYNAYPDFVISNFRW